MKVGKYNKEKGYDDGVSIIINQIKQSLNSNDDFFIMCVGPTGTGKSSLMLHFYEEFDAENADIKYVGLNRYAHAEALKHAKDKDGLRFCANDEADLTRRDHMTKYNKKILALMWQIRGLNIFHWWNNPTADMLDKPLIEERLKGLIYISDKSTDRPRIYHYFTKKALLEIWEKDKNLKHKTLEKHKQMAFYKGAFTQYKGKLLSAYLQEKDKKMGSAIDEFAGFMGEEHQKTAPSVSVGVQPEEPEKPKEYNLKPREKYYKTGEIAQYLGYTKQGFSAMFTKSIKPFLEEGKHYFRATGQGHYNVYDSAIPIIEKVLTKIA